METINFQVDGEWITELARTWFWDEHRPIKASRDLLADCMGGIDKDMVDTITRDILEGRKKFVGINEFELVDDGKQIRSLMDYVDTKERENKIHEIQLDMKANFGRYVDKWATLKSTHPDVLSISGNPYTFEEWCEYLTMIKNETTGELETFWLNGEPITHYPTMGGLWLIQEPETVYEACDGDLHQIGKDDFWKRVYELKADDPDFEDRNNRYLFSIRREHDFKTRMARLEKAWEQKHPEDRSGEMEYLSAEWFEYMWKTKGEYQYLMEPDNLDQWEGLVAPNGDFYSCNFGGHAAKAYHILRYYMDKYGTDVKTLTVDNALDTLIGKGWCATHSLWNNTISLPPFPKRPTQAQVNAILDAVSRHNVHTDISQLITNS